ncbi:MAG TPA: AAA family ATPase [Candidatus Paceibacterota bacterium]
MSEDLHNFVFIIGAQGSGKTTLARLLKEKLNSVYVDFDWIRDFHLNKGWTNTTDVEEEMSFENLVFLVKNYAKHDYKNVIIVGPAEKNLGRILGELKDYKNLVITLYLTDDAVLKNRVLTESRDSGFRDFEQAISFNQKLRDEVRFPNEKKINNTNQTPEETVSQIVAMLRE